MQVAAWCLHHALSCQHRLPVSPSPKGATWGPVVAPSPTGASPGPAETSAPAAAESRPVWKTKRRSLQSRPSVTLSARSPSSGAPTPPQVAYLGPPDPASPIWILPIWQRHRPPRPPRPLRQEHLHRLHQEPHRLACISAHPPRLLFMVCAYCMPHPLLRDILVYECSCVSALCEVVSSKFPAHWVQMGSIP